ncbi:MAG: alpha-L-fucosidase [Lentimicrobiaceae bacterium]|nr:alpha-L-fucosidase [Lentimicrobiaceae bacterium]
MICFIISSGEPSNQVLPTKSQLEWADAEVGAMFHFDLQVFEPTYKFRANWKYQPDLSVFNPKELDTDQWLRAAKAAGATYAVLVAKHCSGFSLWPTKAHPYSVKNTPWRNGKGDIVKDFIASCKKYGIKPGIYASASVNAYLKVNNPGFVISGNPEEQEKYKEVVKTQLTELWSNYGKLFEVWFDGGVLPPEKGGVEIPLLFKKYQPEAIAFQGPYGYINNIRWVGNESGVAPYPCWARADSTTSATGVIQIKGLHGNPSGEFWCPGEADFALRKWTKEKPAFQGGWFWHEGEEDRIRTLDDMMNRYYETVGQNTNMLVGIVVDSRGLVPDEDMKRLEEFGQEVKKQFSVPLGATSGKGNVFTIRFKLPQPVNYVVIREEISKGERVREYNLYGMENREWKSLSKGSCIGHKRIEKLEGKMYTGIKFEITKSEDTPLIKKMECF